MADALASGGKYVQGIPEIKIPAVQTEGNPGSPARDTVYNAPCTGFNVGDWNSTDKNSTAWVYDQCGNVPDFADGSIHINWDYNDSKGVNWLTH